MTEQPPEPPPGSYPSPSGGSYPPPPPPPGGTYPPPPPSDSGGFPPAEFGIGGSPSGGVATLTQQAYTPWISRVGATLLDGLIPGIVGALGFLLTVLFIPTDSCKSDAGIVECEFSALVYIPAVLAGVIAIVFEFWNLYRQGKTGSTVGKSAFKFKVVSEKDGQPIGFLMSFVRQIAHIVDGIPCYVGYFWPLWDQKRQTFADKIMSTVCLPIEDTPAESSYALI
jgi:uncharacterized RDD family membrane protein YckC